MRLSLLLLASNFTVISSTLALYLLTVNPTAGVVSRRTRPFAVTWYFTEPPPHDQIFGSGNNVGGAVTGGSVGGAVTGGSVVGGVVTIGALVVGGLVTIGV